MNPFDEFPELIDFDEAVASESAEYICLGADLQEWREKHESRIVYALQVYDRVKAMLDKLQESKYDTLEFTGTMYHIAVDAEINLLHHILGRTG